MVNILPQNHRVEALAYVQQRYSIANDGCWPWSGPRRQKGYGYAVIHRVSYTAHRLVYELIKGPIPDGLVLDHLCRNPCCVNPDHLEPVTNRENVLRGIGPSAVAAKATHCPHGHEYTQSNTRIFQNFRYCKECRKVQNRADARNYQRRRRAMEREKRQHETETQHNPSGAIGVSWHSGNKRWRAQIKVGGRKIHLGYFLTVEEAQAARLAAEVRFRGQSKEIDCG